MFPLVPATTQADEDDVEPTSKRYLNRVIDLFERKYDNPANVVFKECRRVAAQLGGDTALVFTIGPGKEIGRLIEKALMQKGRYDLIRDYVSTHARLLAGKLLLLSAGKASGHSSRVGAGPCLR